LSRIAIVTGGTKGIGRAICKRLKADGCQIVALYGRDDGAAEEVKEALGIEVMKCDVADFSQCRQAAASIESRLGPVDILVNNAGITRDASLHKMTFEQWDDVMRTDLYSVFNMSRQVIDPMRERGFGRIINISSVNGQKGQFGQTNYCAAKAGIIGFTKALALETARKGITVNAIAPGYIETGMVAAVPADILESIRNAIPIGRLGQGDEIARCVSFLADDAAGLITWATISANGGQYLIG
jgi:acetoacetyl-CoA reductase